MNNTLVNPGAYDYHLASGSPAIDAGTDPGEVNGFCLLPFWEYHHPLGRTERIQTGPMDTGAYEYH